MNEILAVRGLGKVYKNGPEILKVIKDVNLTVKKGESLAIIGVSGAGKSTLLHLLGALDTPTYGEVLWENTPFSAFGEIQRDELRKEKMGFIFQFYHLLPEFTALENVLLPALIKRRYKNAVKIRKKAMFLLEEVGLDERAGHKPNSLSGGEKQRVAIARAVMNEPEIVFADEPTGNLDKKSSELIEKLLFEKLHKEKGKTFVLVTHEESLAQKADRVMRLNEGRLEDI